PTLTKHPHQSASFPNQPAAANGSSGMQRVSRWSDSSLGSRYKVARGFSANSIPLPGASRQQIAAVERVVYGLQYFVQGFEREYWILALDDLVSEQTSLFDTLKTASRKVRRRVSTDMNFGFKTRNVLIQHLMNWWRLQVFHQPR